MNLTDFLLARIAEDESRARAATPSPWVPDDQGWVDSNGEWIICAPYHDLDISDEDAEHVTRWQPARVLAECDAKRQIVETYVDMNALGGTERIEQRLTLRWTCELFALPYADHPDYRDEWRP